MAALPLMGMLCPASAFAADPAPMFGLQGQYRSATADANASPNSEASEDATDMTGGFAPTVTAMSSGDMGNSSQAQASLASDLSETTLNGTGSASASASGNPEGGAGSSGIVAYTAIFMPTNDMIFYLRYDVDANDPSGGVNMPFAHVKLTSLSPTPYPMAIEEVSSTDNAYERKRGSHTGVLRANVFYQLEVLVSASAYDEAGANSSSDAEMQFELQIEDTDCDGLLDIWETEGGIDITGDFTPDIPLDGADKDHKDIFIEYEIVSGVTLPAGALDDVVAAFAAAPNSLVDNPDGAPGIAVHFVAGGDSPSGGEWADEWGSFKTVKDECIGTSAERSGSRAARFKEARTYSHRFLVFSTSTPSGSTGRGEIVGDDCMVHLGTINEGFSIAEQRAATAGTVMHELGHTFGLRHGGIDNFNFKPNYMSVMNYPLQFPFQGDSSIWRLDYSHDALPSLNEKDLDESVGIGASGGVYTNWHTFWNATEYVEGESNTPSLKHGTASGAINWNAKDAADGTGLRIDLNNLVGQNEPANSPVAHFAKPPSLDQVLIGHCDWCGLVLSHLGHQQFDVGVSGPPAARGVREEGDDEPPLDALIALIDRINGVVVIPCPADFNGDDVVDGVDLAAILAAWSTMSPAEDLSGDGVVDGVDLAALLAAWGACP